MIYSYLWDKRQELSLSLSLSQNATIVHRVKEGYLIWMRIVPHIAKGARYTIGARIENTFLDLLAQTYTAYFSAKEKKSDTLKECILTLDILKFLISVTWEGKLISHGQCEELAVKLEEAGKMFGGWQKSLDNPMKKNRDLLADRSSAKRSEGW
jgi:hypothetical protein